MNNGSALRPRLLAVLGAALLLTSCSSAGGDDHRTTDGRASRWGKDMGAPEASAFMKVAVPESATEVKGAVQINPDLMGELGWEPLRNRHLLLERGGDTLVVAGVDDVTAESSGLAGHRAHLDGALRGADPELPVLLLAHQPAFVDRAAAEGVDLQISGHTHGGQIWPFHYPVRLDQPALAGLSHHGARTLLHTSRGTGFWGPPFRVFAPSEITLLMLRSPRQPASS